MATITFEPLGISIECSDGEPIFAAARRAGVPIPTACVGRGTCGLCRVKVLSGEEALSPINPIEKRHLGNTYFITKLRLSCQATVGAGGTAAGGTPAGMNPGAAGGGAPPATATAPATPGAVPGPGPGPGGAHVTLLIPDAPAKLKKLLPRL